MTKQTFNYKVTCMKRGELVTLPGSMEVNSIDDVFAKLRKTRGYRGCSVNVHAVKKGGK